MSFGYLEPTSIMGRIAATYPGGEAAICGCCEPVWEYIAVNLAQNQIYDVKQCEYGAITVTCDTANCSLSYTPVNYNTFKYNIMVRGTLLCNYVYRWQAASLDGACAYPGKRKIDLDPYGDILPNTTWDEDAAWVVDNYMSCATTEDGNGCNCNISTRAHNPLAGHNWWPKDYGVNSWDSNNDPNGLNTHTFFNDQLSTQDYEEYFTHPPHSLHKPTPWKHYPNNG